MRFKEGLVAYLSSVTDVTDLVGMSPPRIYPDRVPQGSDFPAMDYQEITRTETLTHDGMTALARPRIQLRCWALSRERGGGGYDEAQRLAHAVRFAVQGFRGTMGDVEVMGGFMQNFTDRYDEQAKAHGVWMDFFFFYQELVRAS